MSLSTVFLGTPEAAVPTLEALLDSDHRVLAVATAPDRPKGRGMELAASPVKQRAMDAGIPVLQPPTLRTPEAQAELAAAGADVFVVFALDRLEAGTIEAHPQDGSQASYAGKLTPEDARIDWTRPSGPIVDRIRAFSPRPGAWTTLDGRRLKVWRARLDNGPLESAEPGSFRSDPGGSMVVATGDGFLVLDEVQPEGGRRMPGPDFLRGRRGAPGELS